MRRAILPLALAALCVLSFLMMGQAPSPHGAMELYSPGGGLATAATDAAYLRLDATNDPVTGEVYFGSPAGNSIAVDGPNAFLWAQVLDSDASGNFAVVGTSAWDGALWDASTAAASYGESYPGNGYCTSVAQAPGSSEVWINGDPASESRLCAPVGTGLEMGVSTGDGATFENVLSLTGTGAVVNEDGASDLDFRVEGDTVANLLVVDASADRVGVGTATPSTRLEVSGQAAAAVGSASAPSWSFAGDLNTGWYRSAADSLSWSVGGAEGGVLRTTEANFYLPVSVDSGTAAGPSLRFSSDVDTGLYRDTANTVRVSGGGVRAASIAPGAFTVYGTDGTTILMGAQTGSGFVGSGIDFAPSADNTSDLGYASFRWNQVHAEKVQNGASTAGSSPLELNDDTTCPADTSGTIHTFRLPTGMATTHLTRPTCDSSHAGMLIFVDDTNDGDPGEVCVCTDNGTYPGPTWAWWFIDHTKACDT